MQRCTLSPSHLSTELVARILYEWEIPIERRPVLRVTTAIAPPEEFRVDDASTKVISILSPAETAEFLYGNGSLHQTLTSTLAVSHR
jgi:hypothetical protein